MNNINININLMFQRRKYIIEEDNEEYIISTLENKNIILFKIIYETLNIDNLKDKFFFLKERYPYINHLIFLYKRITPITQELIKNINKENKNQNKIILKFLKTHIEDKKFEVELFESYVFMFDILSNFYQPKIKILTQEESKNFKWKNISYIKTLDPIVKYFNLKSGTIIEYNYNDNISYRIVKNEDKKNKHISLNNNDLDSELNASDEEILSDDESEEEIFDEE
jgi:DNA-directed RNA polymerase subunit H (RpoH/RPB5)